jgi:hypothetical protein
MIPLAALMPDIKEQLVAVRQESRIPPGVLFHTEPQGGFVFLDLSIGEMHFQVVYQVKTDTLWFGFLGCRGDDTIAVMIGDQIALQAES